jgi:NAD(P)-dependent dehydrogenase (short-subunit alcohol dehydrogenase family)
MDRTLKNLLTIGGAVCGGALALKAALRRSRWFEWEGKVVVITGGARGLGLVVARQLVEAGAIVAICSRTESQLKAAAEELIERGGEVFAAMCDVTDPEDVREFFAAVLDKWGRVDVLINNAGVIEVGPVESMTREDFELAMATHYWGALNCIEAALPSMKNRRWGRIVNVASIGGKVGVPHLIPYCGSKFALVGLSTALRTELVKLGILVTTVCPSVMRTGSPHNATFKGKHREEFTWFSISDSLPVVSVSAEDAAATLLRACQNGDAEVVIGWLGKLGATMQQLAPQITSELSALVDRWMMPVMGGIGQQSAKGYESHTALSPSLLTRLGDAATVRNNEAT